MEPDKQRQQRLFRQLRSKLSAFQTPKSPKRLFIQDDHERKYTEKVRYAVQEALDRLLVGKSTADSLVEPAAALVGEENPEDLSEIPSHLHRYFFCLMED